ncbi:MAG: lysozyme [Patescibacteria group bacterium]|nr:lysozyme [Patescibacteria group bacterium]
MPVLNAAAEALIKAFEGLDLTAYRDSGGVLTIGYGHTGPDVYQGEVITAAQADDLFEHDATRFCAGVNAVVARALTPNQFGALVSFAYNLGTNALASSTLLRLVNADAPLEQITEQFMRWVYGTDSSGNLIELPGLERRRAAEAKLYGTPE